MPVKQMMANVKTEFHSPRKQGGFNLLEVMIAMVIFSIGLLGLAALEAVGTRSSFQAYSYSIATQQIYNLADRIRNNQSVDYSTVAASGATNCINATCTPANMAAFDLFEWEGANNTLLPSGTGSITRTGNTYTITIMWDDNRTGAADCASGLECISVDIQA